MSATCLRRIKNTISPAVNGSILDYMNVFFVQPILLLALQTTFYSHIEFYNFVTTWSFRYYRRRTVRRK